jgi:hypothetical protein
MYYVPNVAICLDCPFVITGFSNFLLVQCNNYVFIIILHYAHVKCVYLVSCV